MSKWLIILSITNLIIMTLSSIVSWNPYNQIYKTNINDTQINKCRTELELIGLGSNQYDYIYCDCLYKVCSLDPISIIEPYLNAIYIVWIIFGISYILSASYILMIEPDSCKKSLFLIIYFGLTLSSNIISVIGYEHTRRLLY